MCTKFAHLYGKYHVKFQKLTFPTKLILSLCYSSIIVLKFFVGLLPCADKPILAAV